MKEREEVRAGTRHLQQTYSARETGGMQELEKHNLTRTSNAPADFSSNFKNFRTSCPC